MRFTPTLIFASLAVVGASSTPPLTPGRTSFDLEVPSRPKFMECSPEQIAEVLQAAEYASNFASAIAKLRTQKAPFDAPFGQLSKADAAAIESRYFGQVLSAAQKQHITAVFDRFKPSTWKELTYICRLDCKEACAGGHEGIAYVESDPTRTEINICPEFLGSGFKKIAELCRGAIVDPNDLLSTGSVLLHEMMHLAHLIPGAGPMVPIIDQQIDCSPDELAYGELEAVRLAKLDQSRALANADNYVFYALQIYSTAMYGRLPAMKPAEKGCGSQLLLSGVAGSGSVEHDEL